jgi:hypothetical protein
MRAASRARIVGDFARSGGATLALRAEQEAHMLPVSLLMFVIAIVISAARVADRVGTGAIGFAAGFFVLGAIALLSYWTSRDAS